METKSIASFYDSFSAKQVKTGVNLRHLLIFNELKKQGLRKNHTVLEVGCGIGTVSGLLAKYLNKGQLVCADISPQNIQIAQTRLKQYSNVSFVVSDMQDFHSDLQFDWVVMPDVLEHIPEDQHAQLFTIIKAHLHEQSHLFIHIPAPQYQRFLKKARPQDLQIIDQAIDTARLLQTIAPLGFYLEYLDHYSIYSSEHDYQRMVFSLKQEHIQCVMRHQYKIIMRKFLQRLRKRI